MKKITAIILTATEWFDKQYGNSYFSCKLSVCHTGNQWRDFYLPFQYGYGDHYQTTTHQLLENYGFLSKEDENLSLWSIADRDGFKLIAHKTEVSRKKDMI